MTWMTKTRWTAFNGGILACGILAIAGVQPALKADVSMSCLAKPPDGNVTEGLLVPRLPVLDAPCGPRISPPERLFEG